jgi:predicted metal-dependent peptidase
MNKKKEIDYWKTILGTHHCDKCGRAKGSPSPSESNFGVPPDINYRHVEKGTKFLFEEMDENEKVTGYYVEARKDYTFYPECWAAIEYEWADLGKTSSSRDSSRRRNKTTKKYVMELVKKLKCAPVLDWKDVLRKFIVTVIPHDLSN